MRTAPTGPRNGSGEIASAAEAPLMQRMSCGVTMSAERTVQMTCTSLRKPFGQSGRIGRSIMRAVRVARSDALPSRLKKPPGILPAAYIRSSTSIVSGKKSASARASCRPTAVARIIVSPERTTTAPSACLASLPVSNVISLTTDLDRHRGLTPGCDAHMCVPFTLLDSEGGGLSQPRPELELGATRSNAHLPPDVVGSMRLAAQAQLLDEGAIALEVVASAGT